MARSAKKTDEYSETCNFCKKTFIDARAFVNHTCEKQRRYLLKDDKTSILAFSVYQKFYQKHMGGRKIKDRTFEQFVNEPYYAGFMRFARHCLQINPINPTMFIDYILKSGVPLDKWDSEILYFKYVKDFLKKETLDEAIARTIKVMEKWAEDQNENWADFFKKVSPAQFSLWMSTGRISPWILFTATTIDQLYKRCSTEQLNLISQNIDPEFWKLKLKIHRDDVDNIIEIFKEVGL